MKNISLLLLLTIFCADLQAMRTVKELRVEGNRIFRELNDKFKPSLAEKIGLINAENSHKIYLTPDEQLRLGKALCEVFNLVCTDSEVLDMKSFLTLSDHTILTTVCDNDKSYFKLHDWRIRKRLGLSCSIPLSQYESVDLSQHEFEVEHTHNLVKPNVICSFGPLHPYFITRTEGIHKAFCFYNLTPKQYINIYRFVKDPLTDTITQIDPTDILTQTIVRIAKRKLKHRAMLGKIIPALEAHFPSVLALLIADYMMIDLKKLDMQKLLLWLSFTNKLHELPEWQKVSPVSSCCTIL